MYNLPVGCGMSLSVGSGMLLSVLCSIFFFNDTATTEIYTLSLHDALPICSWRSQRRPSSSVRSAPACTRSSTWTRTSRSRSEEHTSELQSRLHLVCRLLLEKKKKHRRQRYVTSCRQRNLTCVGLWCSPRRL